MATGAAKVPYPTYARCYDQDQWLLSSILSSMTKKVLLWYCQYHVFQGGIGLSLEEILYNPRLCARCKYMWNFLHRRNMICLPLTSSQDHRAHHRACRRRSFTRWGGSRLSSSGAPVWLRPIHHLHDDQGRTTLPLRHVRTPGYVRGPPTPRCERYHDYLASPPFGKICSKDPCTLILLDLGLHPVILTVLLLSM